MSVRQIGRPAPAATAGHRYAARPVDPDSGYDVATLALLRWWSVTVSGHESDPVDPATLPAFHREFLSWWHASPEHRIAAIVEEVGGVAPVPVAIGWVVPAEQVPGPIALGARPALIDAVYVVPDAVAADAVPELERCLRRLASAHGLRVRRTRA